MHFEILQRSFAENQRNRLLERLRRQPRTAAPRRVAENLWHILSDLEERDPPIRKAVVLHAAGQGHGTDSTKRLPRLAIDPVWPEEKKRSRAAHVTKKVGTYVRVAREAAKLAGEQDEYAFLPKLLQGTTYAASGEDDKATKAEPEVVDELRFILEKSAHDIAARHDLAGAFESVLRAPGLLQLSRKIDLERLPSWVHGEKIPEATPAVVPARLVADLPSIVLGDMLVGPPQQIDLRLNQLWLDGDRAQEIADRLEDDGLIGTKRPFTLQAVHQVDLVLAPIGQGRVTAFFCLSRSTQLRYLGPTLDFRAHGSDTVIEHGALITWFWGRPEAGDLFEDLGGGGVLVGSCGDLASGTTRTLASLIYISRCLMTLACREVRDGRTLGNVSSCRWQVRICSASITRFSVRTETHLAACGPTSATRFRSTTALQALCSRLLRAPCGTRVLRRHKYTGTWALSCRSSCQAPWLRPCRAVFSSQRKSAWIPFSTMPSVHGAKGSGRHR
jgi:hypothetical protein